MRDTLKVYEVTAVQTFYQVKYTKAVEAHNEREAEEMFAGDTVLAIKEID